MDPIPVEGDPADALRAARAIVESMPGARVVTATDEWLHAEFTSRLFHFVDDLELLADPHERVLHVRSASRVGYSDLGANRRRVEALRAACAASRTLGGG